MKSILKLIPALLIVCGIQAKAQTGGLMKDTAAVSFVNNAAVGGMMEVEAGTMATKKAKSPEVKAYGAKMVKDHKKANAELKKIAMAKGYNQIPKQAKDNPMLSGATGEEFDKHYVGMMVGDHKKTVALFEKASTELQDPELKAFAAKTLPTLKAHLTEIEKIASDMGVSGM